MEALLAAAFGLLLLLVVFFFFLPAEPTGEAWAAWVAPAAGFGFLTLFFFATTDRG